jgi:hypothetical protein
MREDDLVQMRIWLSALPTRCNFQRRQLPHTVIVSYAQYRRKLTLPDRIHCYDIQDQGLW